MKISTSTTESPVGKMIGRLENDLFQQKKRFGENGQITGIFVKCQ